MLGFVTFWLGVAGAAGPTDLPLPATGVADAASLLDPAAEEELAGAVAGVRGARVVVVTVPWTAPLEPEVYADTMLDAWFPDGDGVMFLIAAREKRLLARAGPRVGLDARFLAILAQESMIPRLQHGDVSGALAAGIARVGENVDGGGSAWPIALGLLAALVVVGREQRA
jgi:uncharacterized membrane protein YgcG